MELLLPGYGLILWSVFGLLTLGLWMYALVDILRHNFRNHNDKLMWAIVVVLLPLIGTVLYLAIGRGHKLNYNRQ